MSLPLAPRPVRGVARVVAAVRWQCVLLLAVAGPALARPAKKPPRAAPAAPGAATVTVSATQSGPGQVTFVTAGAVYFDRGQADGLAVGTTLSVTRGGKPIGKCTTSSVSDHWATCVGEGLRAGDRLSAVRTGPDPVPPAPASPPAPDELRRRGQALEAVEVPLVDFEAGSAGISAARRASAALSHTTWGNLASENGPFQVQRLDVGLYDFQVYKGLHASLDLSVLNFSYRPDDHKSPLGSPALLVRQAELSYRSPGVPLTAALGRTNTRYTPGLMIVDGAQVGYRSATENFEAGAYGGLLPDPTTLGVSLTRWTAGAYLMGRFLKGKGQDSSLVQLEARLGYAVRDTVGARLELGAALHAWLTKTFDAHLLVQLGMLSAQAPGLIDGVRLDLGWRPAERFRLFVSGRYQGTTPTETLELGSTVPGQRAFHGGLGVTFEATSSVWVGLSAGTAIDLASQLSQTWVGPDVTFPRLFGRVGGLTLGYQEDFGWLRGRNAWAQLNFTPVNRLRLSLRGNWFQQQEVTVSAGVAAHELGAFLSVDWALNRYLWLRLSGLGRYQVASSTVTPPSPFGGSVMAQLGGQL